MEFLLVLSGIVTFLIRRIHFLFIVLLIGLVKAGLYAKQKTEGSFN
ncbi:hypothetical protein [Pseudalkalibacillus salsuginis]|nr:hypothetical protein [Pseudalkalibacillus salsuginis]MCF6408127.1 hypothetical protein [Pseudalkalibacillus salsuginis]